MYCSELFLSFPLAVTVDAEAVMTMHSQRATEASCSCDPGRNSPRCMQICLWMDGV